MQFPAQTKSVISLLADGSFHSGTEIAQVLGISRTAVWKKVNDLRETGLELSAIPGKGYRLAFPLELLSETAIVEQLSATAHGRLVRLEIHDQLDSTNTRLMGLASGGAPGGTVCLAERQMAGRGRMGRVWHAPYGGGICLSVLWRFDDCAAVSGLSLCVGVAVVRSLCRLGVVGLGLKWPNDILWRERKLGGILLEISGETHGKCAVVIGIGLNVRITDGVGQAIDQAWVDLNEATAELFPSRNRVVAWLLEELLQILVDYPRRGLQAYVDEWRQWHCYQGRAVNLEIGETTIRGIVAGVSEEGMLVLDCEGGGRRVFASGDVRLRLNGRT